MRHIGEEFTLRLGGGEGFVFLFFQVLVDAFVVGNIEHRNDEALVFIRLDRGDLEDGGFAFVIHFRFMGQMRVVDEVFNPIFVVFL